MKLNHIKLLNILYNLESINLRKKREQNNNYRNMTINYWNTLLWEKILEDKCIKGYGIDLCEFNNYCEKYCNCCEEDIERIFYIINKKSKCILFPEFEDFLLHLDNHDYINIINCLEFEKVKKIKTNLKELIIENNTHDNDDNKAVPIIKRVPTPIPRNNSLHKRESMFKEPKQNKGFYNNLKSFFNY